jgi:hypothetical protein
MVGSIMNVVVSSLFKREPKNVVDHYMLEAEKIKYKNLTNFRYGYWIKTPDGMFVDPLHTAKYGDTRTGFEKWKTENPELVADTGKITLRPVRERKKYSEIIGYITEEKLPDDEWHMEVLQLTVDCFQVLCKELKVVDVDTFSFYVFDGADAFENYMDELNFKLHAMVRVYEDYHSSNEFKNLIDKIKG